MNKKGISAKYVYTPRADGLPAQGARALRSGLNLGDAKAVEIIKDSYDRSDGQYNIAGYSMGSVDASYAAIHNAKSGKVVDNLVLIGSPIEEESQLMKQVEKESNIKNVVRYDIPNDPLAPKLNTNVLEAWPNRTKHFYYTNNNEGQQDKLVESLYEQGIR